MAKVSDDFVGPFEYNVYKYSPLPSPTSIRLLRFVINPPNHVAPVECGISLIECTMSTVDLDSNPKYKALSYTWGNPHQVQPDAVDEYGVNNKWPISVDGRLVFVGKNLYETLQCLRSAQNEALSDADQRLEPLNKTPLIKAAEEGNMDAVSKHLQLGADLRCTDRLGKTALHYAAENGHSDIAQLLLIRGASTTALDSANRTPLDCCFRRGAYDKVALVLLTTAMRDKPILPRQESQATKDISTSSTLWIDAICINQQDVSERNVQVAMMARIFQTAHVVLGWLGVADKDASILFDVLQEAKAMQLKKTKYCLTQSCMKPATENNNRGFTGRRRLLSKEQVDAIFTFFARAWFHRTWIIQEIALAQNLVLFCGDYMFTWMDLCFLLQLKPEQQEWSDSNGTLNVKFGRGNSRTLAWCLADIRIRSSSFSLDRLFADIVFKGKISKGTSKELDRAQFSLPTLMALTWNFAVSDPRDKLFALQNITRRCDDERKVTVDYNKSVVQIFTDMARIFIEACGDHSFIDWLTGRTEDFEPLEGLSFVQAPVGCDLPTCSLRRTARKGASEEELKGLPSWVPNFSRPLDTTRLFGPRFHAAGGKRAQIYPSESKILKVDGLEIGGIVEVDDGAHRTGVVRCARLEVNEWLRITSHLDPVYPTGISRVEALWRTMIADYGQFDSLNESFKAFVIFNLFLYEEKEEAGLPNLDILESLRETDFSDSLPSVDEMEHAKSKSDDERREDSSDPMGFFSALGRFTPGRRLVRTDNGYLGLAPLSAQVGDEIWLLGGFRTPVVLRGKSTSGQRQFFGEVYIHGLMHGEAAEGLEDVFAPIELV
ncbi:hypothetical protein ACHAQJ_007104 [Trichoderma viride]